VTGKKSNERLDREVLTLRFFFNQLFDEVLKFGIVEIIALRLGA